MRSASILTGVNTHLDHLGVLSEILGIPLIVTEEKTYQLAKQFYPGLDVHIHDYADLSLHYLAEQFDVIFETGKFWAADLSTSLELFYRKKMRFVYCPHGNSDKGHSLQELVSQDLALVYGQHLFDLLTFNGSIPHIKVIVHTGNYRLPYYLKYRAFYDRITEKAIFQRFEKIKPIILYAPTWNNREHPTSFFSATETIIRELSPDFNLAIKLHPFLIEYHPAHAYALMGRYEQHPSAQFIIDFPPIYPLLAKSICYIGDYSSIGYDFLAFDKPLFFLASGKPASSSYFSPLHTCGTVILPEDLPRLGHIIRENIQCVSNPYSHFRKKTYSYAFGKEKPFDILREDIFHALKNTASSCFQTEEIEK